MNEITKPLTPIGMFRGADSNGLRTVIFLGRDEEGKQYSMCFAYKNCYSDSTEKYLSKLVGVSVPATTEEDKTIAKENDTNGSGNSKDGTSN